MTGLAELDKRVTTLEREMGDVRELASGASKESGDVHVLLRAHNKTLEALRETQLEQGGQLRGLQTGVSHGFSEMRHQFNRVAEFRGEVGGRISDARGDVNEMRERIALFETEIRQNFAAVRSEMRERLDTLGVGVARIHEMLKIDPPLSKS